MKNVVIRLVCVCAAVCILYIKSVVAAAATKVKKKI